MIFRFKDQSFDFAARPNRCVIFGILNITPDSFSDGGRFRSVDQAVEYAFQLQKDGADVIDVGGESTRPGAIPVSVEEELRRVLPVVRQLKERLQLPISIDTTKATVAEACLKEGASIINDVSGLSMDSRMAEVVAHSGAGLILMHMRGTANSMQSLCDYQNLVKDIKLELWGKFQFALQSGISQNQLALDLGIGFAKRSEQNWILLRQLDFFIHSKSECDLSDRPWMVGVSRKSFLGGEVSTRGPATLSVELQAYQQGVKMIRTHDVAALYKTMNAMKLSR